MVYKRRRSYSRPGYSKRRRTIARTYRRRRPYNYKRRTRAVAPAKAKSFKSIVRMGNGLPKAMLIILPYRWAGYLTTTTAGAGPSFQSFRLNSPYDPDYTSTGVSAKNFTTFCGQYQYTRYLVYKVDIMVTFRCAASSSEDSMGAVQIANHATSGSYTPAQIFQNGLRQNYWTQVLSRFDGDKPRWNFVKTMHLSQVWGISKRKYYAEDAYSSVYNNNPAEVAFLNVSISDDPEDTAVGNKVDIEVYLRYHVKLFSNFNE